MGAMASQITSLMTVYTTVYSGADQRKHQSSASLAFVPGIHWGPVNSPHKLAITRKMFPFDDIIIYSNMIVPQYKHIPNKQYLIQYDNKEWAVIKMLNHKSTP